MKEVQASTLAWCFAKHLTKYTTRPIWFPPLYILHSFIHISTYSETTEKFSTPPPHTHLLHSSAKLGRFSEDVVFSKGMYPWIWACLSTDLIVSLPLMGGAGGLMHPQYVVFKSFLCANRSSSIITTRWLLQGLKICSVLRWQCEEIHRWQPSSRYPNAKWLTQ